MAETTTTTYDLHTYFRSSCSARLRIALNLKSIPYNSIPVNLLQDQQSSESHRALNPPGLVPVLVVHNNQSSTSIPQSISALEYLEETHPTPPLLPSPSDPQARATVRTLVDIIACDMQPVTNLRIQQRVRALGGDGAWSKELVEAGFGAYETIAAKSAGGFSVGDQITMADVCLVPACWAAERVGVDIARYYPTIKRVVERMEGEEALKKAHWRRQLDTLEDFRM